MKNPSLLTLCGIILIFAVLVPLDFYANNLVQTNAKQGKEVYSFEYVANIQLVQFTICGLIIGFLASGWMVKLNEFIIKRKQKAKEELKK